MSDLVERLRNYPYEACKLAADSIEALEEQVKFLQWMESFDSGFRSTTLMAREEYEALGEQE